jgi:hypothetical protein
VILRCKLDGLLLPAGFHPTRGAVVALDGDEPFVMEALEAVYYELAAATSEELLRLEQAGYRLLRLAADFRRLPAEGQKLVAASGLRLL